MQNDIFPIFISDRNNPDRTVKINEAIDGTGVVVSVRDEDGEANRFYSWDGGAWALNIDGTLGEQLIGTCDVHVPRDGAALRKFFHYAASQDCGQCQATGNLS